MSDYLSRDDQIRGTLRGGDYWDFLKARTAATGGLPGDLQNLLNAIAGADVFGKDLPTTEEVAPKVGADLESVGGEVGQYTDWTGVFGPLTKALAAMGMVPALTKGAKYGKYADEYPGVPDPVWGREKKPEASFKRSVKAEGPVEKIWLAKGSDDETKAFLKERREIQKEIDAGNYEPYFPVDERFDVDPSKYPVRGNTKKETLAKTEKTRDKHQAAIAPFRKKMVKRMKDALKHGEEVGGHDRWYQMGQLEKEYLDEFGPDKGPEMFRKHFSEAMAATTGGSDPEENLLTAAFVNYMKNTGNQSKPSGPLIEALMGQMEPGAMPKNAWAMPSPVGGRFVSGNVRMGDQVFEGRELGMGEPKRHNFARNFEGHTDMATIDEQMTQGMTKGNVNKKGLNAPPSLQYGLYEGVLDDVPGAMGNRDKQDVIWGGLKDLASKAEGKPSYTGKPMIQIVNEAIERTSRLTGRSPAEVVKGMIRGNIPIYGVSAAAVAPILMEMESKMGGKE